MSEKEPGHFGDRFRPILEQYVLTDLIASGHFERHIRRMRHFYDLRRQVLIKTFKDHFGERATILRENVDIYVMVKIITILMGHK